MLGYGDRRCSNCGYTEYSESEEDFYARIYGKKTNPTIGETNQNDEKRS
jgi:predicted nucleic-acid-binding Zn-ribbon protein